MQNRFSLDDRPNLQDRKPPLQAASYEDRIAAREDVRDPSAVSRTPALAFVIVAYQTGEKLLRCLDAVRQQTQQDFEILLIDNGLDEAIREQLRRYPLAYVRLKQNEGPSLARNLGAALARAPWVAFIDDDGVVCPDYAAQTRRITQEYPDVVAFRGRVLAPEDRPTTKAAHYDLGPTPFPAPPTTEGNLVVRRSDFLKVGGFENDLYRGEGSALGFRMVRFYGYALEQFYYHPELILHHAFFRNEQHLRDKMLRTHRARYFLHLRYPDLIACRNQYDALRPDVPAPPAMPMPPAMPAIRQETLAAFRADLEGALEERARACRKEQQQDRSAMYSRPCSVSVIVTSYDVGPLLWKAIHSIYRQTLSDWELIVVDDASTDPAMHPILAEVEKELKVIRHAENRGVAAARNTGIAAARGHILCCLDGDDTVDATYLEKAKILFDRDPGLGVVSSYLRKVGEESTCLRYPEFTLPDLITACPVHCASCFRRTTVPQGKHYDEALRGYEDWDHWIRIGKHGWKTAIIQEELFFYCRRPDAKSYISHTQSKTLTERIIANHRALYEEHFPHVIAAKHHKLSEQVFANRKLRRRLDRRASVMPPDSPQDPRTDVPPASVPIDPPGFRARKLLYTRHLVFTLGTWTIVGLVLGSAGAQGAAGWETVLPVLGMGGLTQWLGTALLTR